MDNFVQCTVPNSSAYSAVHVLLSQFYTYKIRFFQIFTTFMQMLSRFYPSFFLNFLENNILQFLFRYLSGYNLDKIWIEGHGHGPYAYTYAEPS